LEGILEAIWQDVRAEVLETIYLLLLVDLYTIDEWQVLLK